MLKRFGQLTLYAIIALLGVLGNKYITSSPEDSWVRTVPFMLGAILVVFLLVWFVLLSPRKMYLDWRKRHGMDDPS